MYSRIKGGADDHNNDTGFLSFATNATSGVGSGNPIERMRITDVGKVGIGTNDPATKLEISDSAQGVDVRTTSTNANGYPAYRLFRGTTTEIAGLQAGLNTAFSSNGNHTILYNAVSDGLLIFRNQGSTTNIMALSGSGQVGIGTTAPASSWGWAKFLQIDNATNAAFILTDRAGSTQENSIVTDGAGLYIDSAGHGTAANNKIIFRTEETNSQYSSTERMRIHSSGAITFGNENLVTTGTFGSGVATLASSSIIGNLTLGD